MELFIFGRFHARPGEESALAQAVADVLDPTRAEPGCLAIHAYRSVRDSGFFYIHARWSGEDAFERHAGLPHTVRFIERAEALVDQPIEVTRSEQIA